MTEIVCETATLADAVNRASRIAPHKGSAWDKAHGVVLDVKPTKQSLHVKATDLEVTYLQRVGVISFDGDDVKWRLPSAVLSGVLSALPLGAGQTVTLSDDGADVAVQAGKTTATLRSTDPEDYPIIKPFDPTGMAEVDGLPNRVQQASWAAAKQESSIMTGLHLDGKSIKACDRYALVDVPCVVPVDEPVTASLAFTSSLFKNVGTVKLRATDRVLEIMTDDDTQITALLLAGDYPNVAGIKRDDFLGNFKLSASAFADAINRMMIVARGERYPKLQFKVRGEKKELGLKLVVPGVGGINDAITITCDNDEEFEFWCSPATVLRACEASGKENTTWSYGPNDEHPFRIKDDAGFECWLMPIKPTAQQAASATEKDDE